jgi:hypothetical protein
MVFPEHAGRRSGASLSIVSKPQLPTHKIIERDHIELVIERFHSTLINLRNRHSAVSGQVF